MKPSLTAKENRIKNRRIKLSRKAASKIYKIDISPHIPNKRKGISLLKKLFDSQNINIIQNVINPNYLQVVEKIPNFPPCYPTAPPQPGLLYPPAYPSTFQKPSKKHFFIRKKYK